MKENLEIYSNKIIEKYLKDNSLDIIINKISDYDEKTLSIINLIDDKIVPDISKRIEIGQYHKIKQSILEIHPELANKIWNLIDMKLQQHS